MNNRPVSFSGNLKGHASFTPTINVGASSARSFVSPLRHSLFDIRRCPPEADAPSAQTFTAPSHLDPACHFPRVENPAPVAVVTIFACRQTGNVYRFCFRDLFPWPPQMATNCQVYLLTPNAHKVADLLIRGAVQLVGGLLCRRVLPCAILHPSPTPNGFEYEIKGRGVATGEQELLRGVRSSEKRQRAGGVQGRQAKSLDEFSHFQIHHVSR